MNPLRLSHVAILTLLLPFGPACGPECGDATVEIDGACVPTELACATGTTFDAIDRQCRSDAAGGVTCGTGTRLEGTQCVPVAGSGGLSCGLGTVLSADGMSCVPATEACGAGTMFDTMTRTCVASAEVTCGPGTALMGAECVVSPSVCGPGTVYAEATGTCIRGVAFVGDCANPMVLAGGAVDRLVDDTVLVAGGCFEVQTELAVEAELRIEPGVTVIFAEGARLFVGPDGLLSAVGTAMAPITFRGAAAERGYWDGLMFEASNRMENALEHVVIEHGGREAYRGLQGGLVLNTFNGPTRISLADLTIRSSAAHGIAVLSPTLDRFERVAIEDCADAPISTWVDAVGEFDNSVTFANNDVGYVDVRAGGSLVNITRDAVWHDLDLPYRVDDVVRQGAQVVLQPDIVVQMEENSAWYVESTATFVSVGGVDLTRIEGVRAESGSWGGLIFRASDRQNNILANTVVAHGGGVAERGLSGNVVLSNFDGPVRLTLRDVTLRESAGHGLATRDATLTIDRLTATANANGPMIGTLFSVSQLDANSQLTGNGDDTVQVFGQTRAGSATIARIGVPLRVLDDLQIVGDLVLSQGLEVQFDETVALEVHETGSLTAIGTAAEPVRLVGSTATSGWWTGLRFVDSNRAANRLEHVVLAHGGRNAYSGTFANLILRRISDTPRLELSNVSIASGTGAGVAILGTASIPECAAVTFQSVTPNVVVNGTPQTELCTP